MLQEQINDLQQKMLSAVPPETLALIARTNETLAASGILDSCLREGAKLPEFSLFNAGGKLVNSNALLASGPLVICFYRGGWCPYCNLELRAYQAILADIQALGAQLVAISPNLPDHSLNTIEKGALAFEVLSDPGNKLARACGLVFTLDARLLPLYEQLGLDIPAFNGDDSYELPMPATYVVDQNGIVRLAFTDADYSKRLEPQAVLELLRIMPGR
jgi:peroxiredoxin